MFHRLENRQLYKRIYNVRIRDLENPAVGAALLELGKKSNDERQGSLEQQIADKIRELLNQGVDPHEVIIHTFDINSVRSSSRNDEMSIQVLNRRGPKPFEEASTLFESIDEKYKEGLSRFTPRCSGRHEPTDRRRYGLDEPIREILLTQTTSTTTTEGAP